MMTNEEGDEVDVGRHHLNIKNKPVLLVVSNDFFLFKCNLVGWSVDLSKLLKRTGSYTSMLQAEHLFY